MVSGSGICTKRVVVDASHHMLGRLSSILRNLSSFLGMNSKHSHGPIHIRALAKILWRTICGIIPHKTKRGAARMVIPRLQPGHKYCLLGGLSAEVRWSQGADTIKELEEKRKERKNECKKQLNKLRLKAEKTGEGQLGAQLENLVAVDCVIDSS
ncbi:hypothetical protein MKW92_000215 [Papaver armeniacum]|nr:hypothetical protein MKW92_000215 [Papaver armeniacum]